MANRLVHGLKMNNKRVTAFIENIGSPELYDEIKYIKENSLNIYPRYLTAVMITLIELGYDETWVNTSFKKTLDKHLNFYLENENGENSNNIWKNLWF